MREPAISLHHLLGLEGVSRQDIQILLDTGFRFREVLERPIKKVPTLTGVNVVNLFFENSTRTRISFELAEKRLSAEVITFSVASSSLSKGEGLKDTVRNIHAMKMDAVVMRHPSPGAAVQLSQFVDAAVINAGDGAHEHPTQGLLDMMSLQEKFGHLEGLKVGIIGDVAHSRVARSNIFGLLTMGAEVTVCGPGHLIPPYIEDLGVGVNHDVDELLTWADAVNVLRIQRERQGVGLIPSIREYRSQFGITNERLARHKKSIIILHPGPINRGVEIDSDVADGDQAIILDQVLNGVVIRMSVLYHLLGARVPQETN
ncbi:MAG: aspartate carbamoyltransferase catalytic subunit [Candidatus Marinimicrobia bacterium]|nr:aspartate carbamoyltransferase catalytic subunit [Candidatus Neomarinimicrobiota bacterium]